MIYKSSMKFPASLWGWEIDRCIQLLQPRACLVFFLKEIYSILHLFLLHKTLSLLLTLHCKVQEVLRQTPWISCKNVSFFFVFNCINYEWFHERRKKDVCCTDSIFEFIQLLFAFSEIYSLSQMLCIYNTEYIKYNFTNSPNADQEEWMLALQGSMKCTPFLFIHTYLHSFFFFPW